MLELGYNFGENCWIKWNFCSGDKLVLGHFINIYSKVFEYVYNNLHKYAHIFFKEKLFIINIKY